MDVLAGEASVYDQLLEAEFHLLHGFCHNSLKVGANGLGVNMRKSRGVPYNPDRDPPIRFQFKLWHLTIVTFVCAFASFCVIEYREKYDMGYKAADSRDVNEMPWNWSYVPWRAGFRAGGGGAELDGLDRQIQMERTMREHDAEEKELQRRRNSSD